MAQYSLFVLNIPLNTNKPKQTPPKSKVAVNYKEERARNQISS